MDVTFGEDASRIRCGYEAQNVATLRRVTAFLLQATEIETGMELAGQEIRALKRISLRKRKKWAGWRADYLQRVSNN